MAHGLHHDSTRAPASIRRPRRELRAAIRGGLHAHRAARRAVAHLHPGGDGRRAVPQRRAPYAGERAAHGPLPDARRDRSVLRGQEQVSGLARHARERRLHAEDPRGSDHAVDRHVADGAGRARPEQSHRRSPGSTT